MDAIPTDVSKISPVRCTYCDGPVDPQLGVCCSDRQGGFWWCSQAHAETDGYPIVNFAAIRRRLGVAEVAAGPVNAPLLSNLAAAHDVPPSMRKRLDAAYDAALVEAERGVRRPPRRNKIPRTTSPSPQELRITIRVPVRSRDLFEQSGTIAGIKPAFDAFRAALPEDAVIQHALVTLRRRGSKTQSGG